MSMSGQAPQWDHAP